MALAYLLSQYSGGNSALVGLPLDDAWIHLVYARSFAESGQFAYNPGIPEAGMSSMFWVVLLGGLYKLLIPLGVSPQWCAKVLSLFFVVTTCVVAYRLVLKLGLGRCWALAAGLLVACEPNVAFAAVGGMEAPLMSFLILSAIASVWSHRYTLAGLLLGLALITRPEGVIAVALVGGVPILQEYFRRDRLTLVARGELVRAAQVLLPALVLGGAWLLYNMVVTGHFLPNTFYVKNAGLGPLNWANLWAVLQGYLGQLALFKGLMAVAGGGLLAVATHWLWTTRSFPQLASLIALPLVQVYAFSITVLAYTSSTPWSFYLRRYLDFIVPLLVVAVVVGAAIAWRRVAQSKSRAIILAAPIIAVGVIALAGTSLVGVHRYLAEQYSWMTEAVQEVNVDMGKWLAANLPADAVIATTEAGGTRFFAAEGQVVIDLYGLNTHQCIWRPSAELLNEFKPGYLVLMGPGDPTWVLYERLHTVTPGNPAVIGYRELIALATNGNYPPWPPE